MVNVYAWMAFAEGAPLNEVYRLRDKVVHTVERAKVPGFALVGSGVEFHVADSLVGPGVEFDVADLSVADLVFEARDVRTALAGAGLLAGAALILGFTAAPGGAALVVRTLDDVRMDHRPGVMRLAVVSAAGAD